MEIHLGAMKGAWKEKASGGGGDGWRAWRQCWWLRDPPAERWFPRENSGNSKQVMSSDFLLIYGKTWQSIYNPLKRIEMNLQEAAVWMPRTGSPPGGQGGEPQPGAVWVGVHSFFCQEDQASPGR